MPYRTEIKHKRRKKRETMTKNTKVILWNARSLLPKHHLFQWYMFEHEVDIVFITETWLQAPWDLPVHGYVTERMDRTDGYGGIAVYIKQRLSYKIINKMNQHNYIQILGMEIASIKYYLIYIQPWAQLPIDFFHQHLNLNSGPLVLLGDFNCRYPEIYQNQADRKGIILREATRQHELVLLNSDTPTRISQPIVRSYAVDLIFTSIDIAATTQWLYTEETLGSDHYITTCNVERQNMAPRFIYRRMGRKNVDYKKFQRKLEEKEELTNLT
jgi:hypothetical protein